MADQKRTSRGSEFWQIIFPGLLGLILIGLAGAWIVIGPVSADLSRLAEISTILLTIPILLISLAGFLLFGLAIYLVQRLILAIPPLTTRVAGWLDKVQQGVKRVAGWVVKPIIRPSTWLAGVQFLITRRDSRYRTE